LWFWEPFSASDDEDQRPKTPKENLEERKRRRADENAAKLRQITASSYQEQRSGHFLNSLIPVSSLRLLYWFNPNIFQKIISQKICSYWANSCTNISLKDWILIYSYYFNTMFYFPNHKILLVEKKYKFLSRLWVIIYYHFCLSFISHLP
jgi:hypothetical protein